MGSKPLRVSEEQIAAAQLRVVLDEKLGRQTPEVVRQIATLTDVELVEESTSGRPRMDLDRGAQQESHHEDVDTTQTGNVTRSVSDSPIITTADEDSITSLVRSAVDGDENAWYSLVERYLPLVRSVIRAHGLSGPDADDVSQTVWLRLVEHLRDIREPRAFPGWIKTTTRNECMHAINRAQGTVPVGASADTQSTLSVDEEPQSGLLRAERLQELLEAQAELPGKQRKLLVLLTADPSVSYTAISYHLGIPSGSIGPTRARALDRLRSAITAFSETTSKGNPVLGDDQLLRELGEALHSAGPITGDDLARTRGAFTGQQGD